MRIALFMATSGHSGVDRIVRNLVPAFAGYGLNVDLLKVRGHGPELGQLPSGTRMVDLGRAHVYSSLGPVIRYLRRERPEALLSDKDRVNRVALLARRLSGARIRLGLRTGTTVSVDLQDRSALERRLHYLSMHYGYSQANAIIVPSAGAADDLAAFARLPRDTISVIPNPVVDDTLLKRAAERVEHPWFQDAVVPVILGAGELCARKDFETLLHAFALVLHQREARLLLLGRGKRHARLLALARQLGIAEHVQLPGFVENPYQYMARAALFVLSSRYEGFGNVLVEALAVGTPVVSTDCPSGPREILQEGRIGPLVPPGDAPTLAEAMLRTLDAPPSKERLLAAAAPYHSNASARRYLEVLGLRTPGS